MKAMTQVDNSLFATQGLRVWRGSNIESWLKSILRTVSGGDTGFSIRTTRAVEFNARTTGKPVSIRTRWAQEIVKSHILNEISEANIQLDVVDWKWLIPIPFFNQGNGSPTLSRPPALPFIPDKIIAPDGAIKICIIGAGISGLFLGMLLDSLKLPHISYEILESSERVGGRVYTHHFGPGKKDYYDVGAMRFPKITPLARTFDLFDLCDIELIPYHYAGQMCPTVFNGQLHVLGRNIDTNKDPFRMSISRGGMVPDRTVIEGPESILKRAFGPFFTKLAHNFQDGFIELMKYDHMTTRDYLREKIGLDFYSIWYMETVARLALSPSQTQLSSIFADYHFHQSASGLYDQSLSEAVLDAMDFEYPTTSGEEVQWYRVAGGTYQVIEKMEKRISTRPSLGARVTSIAYQSHESSQPMLIHVDGETQPRKYSAVFNTASLPCMRRMNIGPGTLRPGQQAAIQSVHYDASTKIAIKFKSAWWTRYCQIQGGQASTDLPIRTCVYPSPETNSEAPSRVLLCSYTWGQDAQQMASLIGSDTGGSELEQLLRHNLALLHQNYVDPLSGRPFGHEKMLRIIQDEYEEYHAYDWYSDPCASGAFSYFGPEQFRHFYPELVRPAANGHMFLVGEACSAHHAWISGSLDSAYRGLVQYLHKLIAEGRVAPHVLHELQASWGALDEIPGEVLEWQMYLTQMSMS